MADKIRLMSRIMPTKDKSKIFHSSGYARSQSGSNLGAAAGSSSFETRKTVNEQRRYVQKYNNSRIIGGIYALDRVKKYVPRTRTDRDSDANNAAGQTSDRRHGRYDSTTDRNCRDDGGCRINADRRNNRQQDSGSCARRYDSAANRRRPR